MNPTSSIFSFYQTVRDFQAGRVASWAACGHLNPMTLTRPWQGQHHGWCHCLPWQWNHWEKWTNNHKRKASFKNYNNLYLTQGTIQNLTIEVFQLSSPELQVSAHHTGPAEPAATWCSDKPSYVVVVSAPVQVGAKGLSRKATAVSTVFGSEPGSSPLEKNKKLTFVLNGFVSASMDSDKPAMQWTEPGMNKRDGF